MYGILLKKNGRVKCKDCGGEGSLEIRGSLKVCKACNGLGTVPAIEKAQRALRQFQQPTNYTVSHGRSILKYRGYYDNVKLRDSSLDDVIHDVIHALQALTISGIKAQVIFPL